MSVFYAEIYPTIGIKIWYFKLMYYGHYFLYFPHTNSYETFSKTNLRDVSPGVIRCIARRNPMYRQT